MHNVSHRYHRRSIRLRGYDYSTPGAYFVTIIVRYRQPLLSRIVNGKLEHLPAGEATALVWQRVTQQLAGVTLDSFVIMPDHLHAIIMIGDTSAKTASPSPDNRPNGTQPGSLPAIVQNLKSVSARRINQLRGTPGRKVWQEDYYEHIIRDDAALARIRRYIVTNPSRWQEPRW